MWTLCADHTMDASTSIAVLALRGEILVYGAGRDSDPEDKGNGEWEANQEELLKFSEEIAAECPPSEGDSRGDFPRVSGGASYGGGQGVRYRDVVPGLC